MNFSLNCVIKYILLSFYFLATKEHLIISNIMASLVVQTVKNPPNNVRDRVRSWVGKIPWQSRWQPTPVFLPGEYHGQRNLAGYSPWGCPESDTTERLLSVNLCYFLLFSNDARKFCMFHNYKHICFHHTTKLNSQYHTKYL